MYFNNYNPNMNMMMSRFKDYPQFIKDLEAALVDEKSAALFYEELYNIAPTETAKYSLKIAMEDERNHYKQLKKLYIQLTGRKPKIKAVPIEYHHFYDGLKKAFLDQVEAYEFYKEMYLSTDCPTVRDILYSIQHDEMEHATLFNWVHTEIK